MGIRIRVLWLIVLAVLASGLARAEHSRDWSKFVLKVEVTHADHSQELGSAVPLAGTHMITNCHVLRETTDIQVANSERQWHATMANSDAYRDLCFLDVPDYQGPAVPMAGAEETRVGMRVLAVGYSDGLFAVHQGQIKGLHTCPCDGGRVIQTSAPFDRGASGGGLFDSNGRLVGILTFKSQAGGDFHFALPVGWLRNLARKQLQALRGEHPFWEHPGQGSGYFLAACALDAKKHWGPLSDMASEWTRQEADNPEAWMALGRARLGLNRPETAAAAFRQVLLLDPSHEEARWELQKLEFELDKPLLDPGTADTASSQLSRGP